MSCAATNSSAGARTWPAACDGEHSRAVADASSERSGEQGRLRLMTPCEGAWQA
ncbi:hypothetical protein T261_7151 [Streptomyces lydicus]|nr:hypothetical protein T261_7151 [Streptomyces lydicus]